MSADRILTTHVGRLARPPELLPYLRALLAGETVDQAAYEAFRPVVAPASVSPEFRNEHDATEGALYQRVHPTIMWAKLRAMVDGADIATKHLSNR